MLFNIQNMNQNQQKNVVFFVGKLPSLLSDVAYKEKYVVVAGEELRGAFDNFDAALSFALSRYVPTEFIIQQVIDEKDRINFLHSASV